MKKNYMIDVFDFYNSEIWLSSYWQMLKNNLHKWFSENKAAQTIHEEEFQKTPKINACGTNWVIDGDIFVSVFIYVVTKLYIYIYIF